jgi:hypothetical protein
MKQFLIITVALLGFGFGDGPLVVDKSRGEWTLMVIPDMQTYTENWTEEGFKWTEEVATFQWIVDKADDLNIQFVQSLGDMVECFNGHNDNEWGRAQQMYYQLLDAGIRATPLAGNHEWEGDEDYTWMNNYFPVSKFQGYPWWGGSHPEG